MTESAKRGLGFTRSIGSLAATLAALPLVLGAPSLLTAPQASAALPDQLKVVTLATYPGRNSDNHGGIMCTGSRDCAPVAYPYLDRNTGAQNLQTVLEQNASGEPLVAFGYSQGAHVVGKWLKDHAGTTGAPPPESLSFVLIGNPDRKYGGTKVRLLRTTTPATDYDVIDVTRQYDRASDWPDDPMNILAFLNACAGLTSIHVNYDDVDIYDSANYVWKEGNTTYVFVPTKNIPLLEPLRKMGLNDLADKLNDPLKARIEKAYNRSYLPKSPGWPQEPLPPSEPTPPAVPELPAAQAISSAKALSSAPAVRKVRAAKTSPVTMAESDTGGKEADVTVEQTESARDRELSQDSGATGGKSADVESAASDRKNSGVRQKPTLARPFMRLFERSTRTKAGSATVSNSNSASAQD
ncbi:PE-PPE domain-containing protein [Mycobacterium sp. BK558]|nr:PE-PPE domain-containing protein [Mycobacterium sp. BK558]